ncbi:MAG: DNA repair protein RadA [Candidatus Shapirobacteria bacterium]|nr:DNA repair protein RadA [Candidatus Shapirobacteria bacterium]
MKKKETVFVCSNCGNEFGKWMGQCSACGEWNSLKEVKSLGKPINGNRAGKNFGGPREVKKVADIETKNEGFINIISTEIKEFDRVLGKGIVQGSVTLFAGEPGIGKSTLLTQLVGKVGGLYIAGEESAEQIAIRVKRLGLKAENFDIFESNSVEEIEEYLNRVNNLYKIVVVDSIQVVGCENVNGVIGSVGQIRESTFRLVQLAKKLKVAMFIVGHVTKDGDIAGPKLLEHMVDTVLYFEGEKNGELRILRVNKNRFGPTDEVGIFKMTEKGLSDVSQADLNLVSGEGEKVGSAVTVLMEGTRPVMVEIQALIVESFAPMPRRVFAGVDFNRGQLLTAIGQKSLGMPLYKYDVFISVTGGIKVDDTGADLAILAAMWSSYKEKPMVGGVFVGEVSLLGEVRKVKFWEKRKKETEAMGKKLIEIKNVKELK